MTVLRAYTPLSEAGIAFWADPRDPEYVAGQTVATLTDKSAGGESLTQATSSFRPIVEAAAINGRQALRFDGVDDRMVSSVDMSSFVSASAFTMYAVYRPLAVNSNASASRDNDPVICDAGQGKCGIYLKASNPTVVVGANDDGTDDQATAYVKHFDAHYASIRHSGGNLYLSVDGAAEVSVASGNTSLLTGVLGVGMSFGGAFFSGYIGTVIVASADHSDAARSRVRAYLRREWGLS